MDTPKPQIIVKQAKTYGRTTYYPVCSNAHTFASIARTTTLTTHTLKSIKDLGYELDIQQSIKA